MTTVYLCHIEGYPGRPHLHYCGSTSRTVDARFREHLSGHGARLVAAALDHGCQVTIVRTWTDTVVSFEYYLKHVYKRLALLCPQCNPHAHGRLPDAWHARPAERINHRNRGPKSRHQTIA